MVGKGVVSEILKQKLGPERKEKGASRPKEEAEKRTSITLPESLYRALKACAAVENLKLNALMVELLQEGLKRRLQKKNLQKELESMFEKG